MQQLSALLNIAILFSTLAGVIGLLVGSFLNVVIYRLPIMMQRGWRKECLEYLQIDSDGVLNKTDEEAPFNLVFLLT